MCICKYISLTHNNMIWVLYRPYKTIINSTLNGTYLTQKPMENFSGSENFVASNFVFARLIFHGNFFFSKIDHPKCPVFLRHPEMAV